MQNDANNHLVPVPLLAALATVEFHLAAHLLHARPQQSHILLQLLHAEMWDNL